MRAMSGRARVGSLLVTLGCALGASGAASASTTPDDTGGESSAAEEALDLSAFDTDAVVRFAYAGPIDTLDPHKPTISTHAVYHYPIYDRLFQADVTNSLVPMVASEWEFSEDGSTLTVTMRDDVVFHDGSPVNAAAVKASIERGQTVEGSTVATLLGGITAVEVVDEFVVSFSLEGIGVEVLSLLSGNAGAIINPTVMADESVNLDVAPPAAAGSGPFVVTSSEPNVSTTYERAPEYWNPEATKLAGLTVTFVAQGPARLAGLQAGDFDLFQATGEVFFTAQAEAEAGTLEWFESPAATRDLLLNIESGDLADPDVRTAISLAVDREAIAQLQPCLPHSQPHHEGHWAHNPNITPSEFDPDAARELIEARGGASFEITYAAGSSYEQIAIVLQEQLGAVGITVELRPMEQAQVNHTFEIGEAQSILTSIQESPDPVETLGRYFTGGLALAKGDLGEQVSTLATEGADPSLSQEERMPFYHEAFQMIADNNLYVPICRAVQGWAYTLPLVGLETIPGIAGGLPNFSTLGVAAE